MQPQGLYSPWNSPGQNIGVGSLSLLQQIFLTQRIKLGSPELQADSLPTELSGKPRLSKQVFTDVFKLWCWRILLRVPWTARRSNQSILKEINPEYPLERLMLKLKLHSFVRLRQSADSLGSETYDSLEKTLSWKRLQGGGEASTEDRMTGWPHRLHGHEFEQALGGGEGQGSLVCCSPWDLRVGRDRATEQQLLLWDLSAHCK